MQIVLDEISKDFVEKFARRFLGMILSLACLVKAALRNVCLILQKKTPG